MIKVRVKTFKKEPKGPITFSLRKGEHVVLHFAFQELKILVAEKGGKIIIKTK